MNQYFKQKVLQRKNGGGGTKRQLKVILPGEQECEVFNETLQSLGRVKIRNIGVEAFCTGHTPGDLGL